MQNQNSGGRFGLTDLMLLVMIVIWAVNFSVVKYGAQTFSTEAFAVLRLGSAMVILLALAWIGNNPWPSRRDILMLCILGVIGHGIYQLLFIGGVAKTRVADSALIISSCPALIAVASRMKGIEKIRRRILAGIALSLVGVALIIFNGTHATRGASTPFGIALIVCAVICWTIFTIYLQPYTLSVDPVKISAITMVGGVVPLLFVAPRALSGVNWSSVSMGAWGALFYSSVISLVIAYMAWYRGIKVLGPTRTSVYTNLQPIIAIAVAWMMLGEVPTVWQGIGMGTIVTGVFLSRI